MEEAFRQRLRSTLARHRDQPERVRGDQVPYQRRGEMSIPAFRMKEGGHPAREGRDTSLRLMKKAATLPVDFFFFDCEDAAPDHPEYKAHARLLAAEALLETDFGHRVVAFRPNGIRTPFFEDDVVHVVGRAGHRLAALVLPKTETADEVADVVRLVDELQTLHERTNRIMLEVLIESPRAFTEAERIAALPGVAALVLGPYDLARTVGGRVNPDTWLADQGTVRHLLPLYAAAHGKDAVDGITATLPIRPPVPAGASAEEVAAALHQDPEALDRARWGRDFIDAVRRHRDAVALARRDARDARRLGFAAKWILHPDQVDAVQSAWTPTRAEALAALSLCSSYAHAARRGSGAELHGVVLTDKAVVGADWWQVEAALRAGILNDTDVHVTGLSLEELRRTVRTRD